MYQLPENSRVKRAIQPANNWNWQEMLLNKISYLLEVLIWQNTQDAHDGKTGSAPKLYTPPFLKELAKQALNPDQEAHSIDDIKDILSRPRE